MPFHRPSRARPVALLWLLPIALVAACQATGRRALSSEPSQVSFVAPNGDSIKGDLYRGGDRGVVIIAHGGYSTRASWATQARLLAERGFYVLVFRSRAAAELDAGRETACLYDEVCQAVDVLAGVRYLRSMGARTIAAIGGSMGGGAVAQASVDARPNEIDRIVLLAPAEISSPERMKGRKFFITTRNDANAAGLRLPGIQAQYDRAPEPKKLLLLEGSAHGQRLFLTEQGDAVMRAVMRFLSEP
jgi:alpha-beta hydrolase superfamily lysophospholipase